MKFTAILIIFLCLFTNAILTSIQTGPPADSTDQKIDNLLAQLWKIGGRYHYTTTSAIKETECDNLKQNLNEIKDYMKQKYSSNQLVVKSIEILVKGREKYQLEEVCTLIGVMFEEDLLLSQAIQINAAFKDTSLIRKNFTNVLLSAIEAKSPIDLPQLLCLTKLWSEKTVEKIPIFFNTRNRIQKLFELTIIPILRLFESSGYNIGLKCQFNQVSNLAYSNNWQSFEILLNALNHLTVGPTVGSYYH